MQVLPTPQDLAFSWKVNSYPEIATLQYISCFPRPLSLCCFTFESDVKPCQIYVAFGAEGLCSSRRFGYFLFLQQHGSHFPAGLRKAPCGPAQPRAPQKPESSAGSRVVSMREWRSSCWLPAPILLLWTPHTQNQPFLWYFAQWQHRAMFHTLMAAGMFVDLFQKEQKPVLQVSAPTTSSSQQPYLYSVAFVTFGGDSLAFPFVFQSSSQNQIPKMKMYQWCAWSYHPLLP